MLVNGLPLPDAFLQLSQALARGGTHWFVLQEKADAYGNPFDGGLQLWTAADASQSGTDWLSQYYGTDRLSPEEIQALNDDDGGDPGEIPYISDFSKIVCFGQDSGSDDPFCFDFRDNPEEPSIVYYNGWYWRRVAPSFREFIGLYSPSRFVVSEAEAREMYGSTPERLLKLEERMFSREALTITEGAVARTLAG